MFVNLLSPAFIVVFILTKNINKLPFWRPWSISVLSYVASIIGWSCSRTSLLFWLSFQLQSTAAVWLVPSDTTCWERHLYADNLPRIIAWKQNGHDSNAWPLSSEHFTPRGHTANSNKTAHCNFGNRIYCREWWSFYVGEFSVVWPTMSWSQFLAVSLQVTFIINPAVGCHYFPPGLQLPSQLLRGLLPISLLGEQRHDGCEQCA